jgi:uncharacterized protein (DUF1800 family)
MNRLVAGAAIIGLASAPVAASLMTSAVPGLGILAAAPPTVTANDASRFLTQATFGPTDSSIGSVQSSGISSWISQQEALAPSQSSVSFLQSRLVALDAVNPSVKLQSWDFYDSFWKSSITAPDQLRQRVKLALSEIFVISFSAPGMDPLSVGSYYDTLGKNAFGNYRTLLEQVTLHPMMGNYLNMLGSTKADPTTGGHADENYAREIQQLMSIGLYQLNQDGSVQTDATGAPIPTYTISDIQGLAKVFTGFSWYSAKTSGNGSVTYYLGQQRDKNWATKSMVAYPAFHSMEAKSFLGTTIPASTTPDPTGDLKIALDTIFNHPNVGPFIGKQLIQRLVTSNPSPAYISRVAGVFNNNGAGVRGDLGAVVRAVLTDPEARDPTAVSNPTFGKLREPVVRLANWARAFKAKSYTGWWLIGDTSAPDALRQAAMNSPTVFNFWRPGYSPPGTTLGAQSLVAPEFQVVDEVSVAGYLNVMLGAIGTGIGPHPKSTTVGDVFSTYATEVAIARDSGKLADRMNLLLLYGQMSPGLRTRIVNAVNAVVIPAPPATTAQVNAALANRAELAVFMTTASPEYLAQR